MTKKIPFAVWTKSENLISFYDNEFADQADSFQLLFVRRQTCESVIIDVDEVKACKGIIKFCFSVDCQILEGLHDATLTNTTKNEVVVSDYPTTVFDVPLDCIKNPVK